MEKLEVMVQDLIWEKRGDGGGDKKRKKRNAVFCAIPSVTLLFLPLKSRTQSAEGQWGD